MVHYYNYCKSTIKHLLPLLVEGQLWHGCFKVLWLWNTLRVTLHYAYSLNIKGPTIGIHFKEIKSENLSNHVICTQNWEKLLRKFNRVWVADYFYLKGTRYKSCEKSYDAERKAEITAEYSKNPISLFPVISWGHILKGAYQYSLGWHFKLIE